VKAVFVDTDQVPALDSKTGDLVQNVPEAKLVYQVCRLLSRYQNSLVTGICFSYLGPLLNPDSINLI